MDKLKAMLMGFVKPLVLAHLADLSLLDPLLSQVLQDKSHMSKEQADMLAVDLVNVVETELAVLINKI